MRRLILALAATVALSTMLSAPAHAAAGCVNKDEYDNAKMGWTRSQLEVMIGANPDFLLNIENATITGYNHCGGNTQMMAGFTFRNGVLWAKDWTWREL